MNKVRQLISELRRAASDDAMRSLVASAKGNELGLDDVCDLARALAQSGEILVSAASGRTADLASTGAPGSLSTLLTPLYLRVEGFLVPKLGVPGRPAGGVDVLAQLAGYNINLTIQEVQRVLDRCGYAHFVAGGRFAPLDAKLFRFRQENDAQRVPALVVASLLAKKIACGVTVAGLDVRVAPHGNFGGDFESAKHSARLFCEVARALGIRAIAALTDARAPAQPFLGRGESLLALRMLFENRADAWLREHADRCRLFSAHIAAVSPVAEKYRPSPDPFDRFQENIEAQGSSMDAFWAKTDLVASASRHAIEAKRDGFLNLDIPTLRDAIVNANSQDGGYPDHIGVHLQIKPGSYVRRGDTLAAVRASDAAWAVSHASVTKAFQILDTIDYAPGLEGIVRA